MDLDPQALQLLLRLTYRVTMAVGDNLPRLARSLGLSPRQFTASSARLLAEGLAERDELGGGVYRLAVTDRGLARAAAHRPPPAAPAPAPPRVPGDFPDPDPEARTPPWRALARLPLLAYRALRWRGLRGGWLLPHLLRHRPFNRLRLPPGVPVDVLVLVSDHFEPARRAGHEAASESVRAWCADYEALADRHRDADGRPPQHTWFYRYDYPNLGCLRELSASAFRGFGEVEFHLHHGHDSHATFAATLRAGLAWFASFGALLGAEAAPRTRFGYLAGNCALDNGAGDDSMSGCDTELSALRRAGCYADFTFPCLGSPAQPRLTNAPYYAREDGRAKSYDRGVPLAVGRRPRGDLLIFPGPVAIDWGRGAFDDGALEDACPPAPRRLGAWLSGQLHVPGRPEWVFVKLHTHGMQSRGSFLGPAADALWAAMGRWWNRPPFRLHFVTAREAYNIAKAAEAGHAGDPNDYRDFLVPPPANRRVCGSVPWRLLCHTPERVAVEVPGGGPARLEFAGCGVRSVAGKVRRVELALRRGEAVDLEVDADGEVEVSPARYRGVLRPRGGQALADRPC